MTVVDALLRVLTPVFERWAREDERRYRRLLRLRALRARRRWRKADVPRLLRIGVGPAAQRLMARLLEGGGPPGGPGVVAPPRTLAEEILERWRFANALLGPATEPRTRRALYKQTRWWPHLIEAAYRGELDGAARARGDPARPHLTASEHAELNVAKAAGISPAQVHQLCHRARSDRGDGPPEYPEMSAAELARHLEEGPRIGPRPS